MLKYIKKLMVGAKIYSPICGKCEFLAINDCITVKDENDKFYSFSLDGKFTENGECMLFPSEHHKIWCFCNGDIIKKGETLMIINYAEDVKLWCWCIYNLRNKLLLVDTRDYFYDKLNNYWRFATEEEKEILFAILKQNGYQWYPVNKTMKILPKFKVGETIQCRSFDRIGEILSVEVDYYEVRFPQGIRRISISDQDNYETVKYSIGSIKPFTKVLVRQNNDRKWNIAFFGYYANQRFYTENGFTFQQCVPFLHNEHLLNSTLDCCNYYKNW